MSRHFKRITPGKGIGGRRSAKLQQLEQQHKQVEIIPAPVRKLPCDSEHCTKRELRYDPENLWVEASFGKIASAMRRAGIIDSYRLKPEHRAQLETFGFCDECRDSSVHVRRLSQALERFERVTKTVIKKESQAPWVQALMAAKKSLPIKRAPVPVVVVPEVVVIAAVEPETVEVLESFSSRSSYSSPELW